ncbi:hypothetical protein L218DRAFT_987128 [Marasmius fiardii PR-910]|nr:hypothetical protein L218DRAFT_987128 [Marasmius fiardii PR-910]
MNSVSAQNLEDAANIATEFLYSIENIPNEVKYLLEEILHKETKTQQLHQQIESDSARWMKHSLRGSTPTSASPSPSPSSPTKSVGHLPARIKQSYTEIDQIAAEKIVLSERLIELINRTAARLDVDLNKVRQLQGDSIPDYTKTGSLSAVPTLTGSDMLRGVGSTGGLGGRDPTLGISESLKMALGAVGSASSSISEGTRKGMSAENGGGSGATTPSTKRRRTAASPSIKLPPTKSRSISPAASGAGTTTKGSHSRSRLSRQIHPPPRQMEMADEAEEDAEGDEDAEGEDDEDADDKLYCFCQKTSYGDMIACDNEGDCPYEWFHLSCVGLNRPVPETWYCSVCSAKLGNSSSTSRKGRKK